MVKNGHTELIKLKKLRWKLLKLKRKTIKIHTTYSLKYCNKSSKKNVANAFFNLNNNTLMISNYRNSVINMVKKLTKNAILTSQILHIWNFSI